MADDQKDLDTVNDVVEEAVMDAEVWKENDVKQLV
eukprot:CAMPEP_0204825602 /NCGR_PEP_ID=MMETSP1346-20131115/3453_1 /ASSEMBLY_ACC=CAM_ASM_000771 /TAXON_ID=215587 /ORGANISM="Aplanochytrium stocchinoi, Strain GSBS06" /LENGTH=34 /DNA_ID= /DNA_START= /DNA_END= /DNA_ORIENTATION=